jgi:succinylglutamate desuccinylase
MIERQIGRYTHDLDGPLLIVVSAMHGNERAGVKALDYLFKMLEVEPITNHNFQFRGEILGMIGNLEAFKQGSRYIDHDLNRIWLESSTPMIVDLHELTEKEQIIELIDQKLSNSDHREVILLDLHTTSSDGGIFTIPGPGQKALEISKSLNAPVILDMMSNIKGTIMEYFNPNYHTRPIHSLTFESGRHLDPLSVNRAIAAIINCMKYLNMVEGTDVESIHDHILKQYSQGLPKVSRLIYRHPIQEGDSYKMREGFLNFQPINQHEPLAEQNGETILSPLSGRILMPLYQKQGAEGFYIIEDVKQ